MQDRFLIESAKTERWQECLDKATNKDMNLKLIKELCYPSYRKQLYTIIAQDKYNIFYSHVAKIPKDKKGEFRRVHINEDRDRILLSNWNDCAFELFPDMIHPQCRSYLKSDSSQKVVKDISKEIVKLSKEMPNKQIGYKIDFHDYFGSVNIEAIDNIFDEMERRLGFEKNTEPIINTLRRYYHQDMFFDENGNICEEYQGLKQGCAFGSFLADVVLYELDDFLSKQYKISYRYSDDLVVIDKDTSNVINEINEIISKYGVTLNPRKVEPLYADKFFKFLGFNIKGSMITLSATRVKKFQKEIEKRSIDRKKKNKKFTGRQAKKEIVRFLYEGEYNWSSSCLGTINVEPDIQELNKFIMDCIKACDTGKLKIGGLGSVNNLPDRTILRGKGKNVKANRDKIEHIENYLSVDCLRKGLRICKPVFEAQVRSMKG